MDDRHGSMFIVRMGAQQGATTIRIPLRYTGPGVLTDVELAVSDGYVLNVNHQGVGGDLAPGDKWLVEIHIDDAPGPRTVIVDVRAAGGVVRWLVVNAFRRRRRLQVTEHPAG